MRIRSCRGATSIEYVIILGLLGSFVIFMSTFDFRSVERGWSLRSTQSEQLGGMCR
jgi:hypothetical protein